MHALYNNISLRVIINKINILRYIYWYFDDTSYRSDTLRRDYETNIASSTYTIPRNAK